MLISHDKKESVFESKKYSGYKSYEYLEAGIDYTDFKLSPEFNRVPKHDFNLDDTQAQRVAQLLKDNIVVSLHDHPTVFPEDMSETRAYNRTGRQRTGYAGLAKSGMTVVFDNMMDGTACVTSKFGWKFDDVIYDLGMRLSDIAHQDFVTVCRDLKDIEHAHESGNVTLVMSLEAATPIENEPDRLDILYGLGIRSMGIAYSESNSLGSGLKEPGDGGLTMFGRQAVKRMNQLGIAIDVSHSSDQTCLDTIEHSNVPVLITHAGARAIWPTKRMKPDEVLKACAESGGVIGLEAAPHTTLSRDHIEHSIESVMDHFEYCVELVGIDHVSFGPDTLYGDHVGLHDEFVSNLGVHYANAAPYYPKMPYVSGLENPTECFFNIVAWLVKHGYSDEDIVKVIGGNTLRALKLIW